MTDDARRLLLLTTIALLGAACSGDGAEAGGDKTVDSADGELEMPRRKGPPYKAVPVTAAGTITGTVAAAAAPAAPASGACAGRRPAGASPFVVFLEDIQSGRAVPVGTSRRHELAAGSCELTPRVSIASAGGTLNLSNGVRFVHHVAFTFDGMKNPMLKVPFSDPGQLVPSEKVLAVPGLVEVRSDQDPSVRAQLVVVDHPYAVATTDGRFTIDSVPPGTYTLVAVGANGRAETKVEVRAGAASNVALQLQAP